MADRKFYRNTRTDSIRQSTSALGYPYEEISATEAKAALGDTAPAPKTSTARRGSKAKT